MASLTVLAGFPGVGKTFVSRELSQIEGATVLSSDRIRNEITDGSPSYTGEESNQVYDELFRRAYELLTDNTSVILDATFGIQYGRDRALSLADDVDVEFRLINVVCNEDVAKTRIRNRTDSISDADTDIYEHIKERFEPFDQDVITIDNSGGRDATLKQLRDRVA